MLWNPGLFWPARKRGLSGLERGPVKDRLDVSVAHQAPRFLQASLLDCRCLVEAIMESCVVESGPVLALTKEDPKRPREGAS